MLKIISISNKFPDVETTDFSGNVSLTDFDVVIIDPLYVVNSFPASKIASDNERYINDIDNTIASQVVKAGSKTG